MGQGTLVLKYSLVTAGALVTTLLCFLTMVFLIDARPGGPDPELTPRIALVHSTRTKPDARRRRQERELPTRALLDGLDAPKAVLTTPALPRAVRPDWKSSGDIIDRHDGVEIAPPVSELMPLYIAEPAYPARAAQREIEGFVVVRFSVRSNGTVLNPVITESVPDRIFDDATLSAIDKFKFSPRTINGSPTSVEDVEIKFVFRLTDEGTGTIVARLQP